MTMEDTMIEVARFESREQVLEALGKKRDLTGADLGGLDLSGLRLFGVTMAGANLRDADLRGCLLVGINASKADLSNAQ